MGVLVAIGVSSRSAVRSRAAWAVVASTHARRAARLPLAPFPAGEIEYPVREPASASRRTISHQSRRATAYLWLLGAQNGGMQRQRGVDSLGICRELMCSPAHQLLLGALTHGSLGATTHLRLVSAGAADDVR